MLDNKSESHIFVVAIDKNTKQMTQNFRLEAGAEAIVFIAKFETMIFQNPSNEEITLLIGFSKEVEGMRYQNVKEYK